MTSCGTNKCVTKHKPVCRSLRRQRFDCTTHIQKWNLRQNGGAASLKTRVANLIAMMRHNPGHSIKRFGAAKDMAWVVQCLIE